MSKIIKIYVKTAAEEEPDIFCIKLDKDCTLVDLKNKIYLRFEIKIWKFRANG